MQKKSRFSKGWGDNAGMGPSVAKYGNTSSSRNHLHVISKISYVAVRDGQTILMGY